MPTEMLKQLAQQTLPINVESIAEVDKIRVLRAAGLIMALFMKKWPRGRLQGSPLCPGSCDHCRRPHRAKSHRSC